MEDLRVVVGGVFHPIVSIKQRTFVSIKCAMSILAEVEIEMIQSFAKNFQKKN